MSTRSRAFLLALAVALAVTVFYLGASFRYNAESPERASGSTFFWLLPAVLFASPLWVPAILSTRLGRVSVAVRWLSATALLVPLWYTGSVVFNQFRVYPGQYFSVTILIVAAALSAGCVAAIAALIGPSTNRDVGNAPLKKQLPSD